MANKFGTIISHITNGLFETDDSGGTTPVRVRTIDPDEYLEGIATGTATITGIGFSANNNSVTIDGNSATISSQSTTEIQIVIPSGSGTVDVIITNDDNAESDTLTNGFTYLSAPGTPILTSIESAMATILSGLTTGGGYHYKWGTANQDDKVLQDANMVAEIRLSSEDNIDEPDGVDANSYLNSAFFEIIVQTTMDDVKSKPIWAVNAYHNKAIDDLKRAFGINYHLNNTANSIMYRSHDREILQNGDLFTPGKITSIWRVDYAQDREDVSINANT